MTNYTAEIKFSKATNTYHYNVTKVLNSKGGFVATFKEAWHYCAEIGGIETFHTKDDMIVQFGRGYNSPDKEQPGMQAGLPSYWLRWDKDWHKLQSRPYRYSRLIQDAITDIQYFNLDEFLCIIDSCLDK